MEGTGKDQGVAGDGSVVTGKVSEGKQTGEACVGQLRDEISPRAAWLVPENYIEQKGVGEGSHMY